MVGSQQGWHGVSYAAHPCNAKKLMANAFAFETPWGCPAWIIPGVNGMSLSQQPDVMHGEEVQLLGLATSSQMPRKYVPTFRPEPTVSV
jgi:2-dehydro-3-deoxygalactonokinase